MQRQSLLDGDDFSAIGKRGGGGGAGGGGGMEKTKVVKLAVAAAPFVVAAGLLAWNFGLIGGEKRDPYAAPPPSAEKVKQREESQEQYEQELEQLQKDGKATIGGA